jgi:hypothetical protein
MVNVYCDMLDLLTEKAELRVSLGRFSLKQFEESYLLSVSLKQLI